MEKETKLAILKKARAIIGFEGNWIKRSMAQKITGTFPGTEEEIFSSCSFQDEQACRFCALGAVCRAIKIVAGWDPITLDTNNPRILEITNLLQAEVPVGLGLTAYNDWWSTKHKDVVALFDRTIENLEKN